MQIDITFWIKIFNAVCLQTNNSHQRTDPFTRFVGLQTVSSAPGKPPFSNHPITTTHSQNEPLRYESDGDDDSSEYTVREEIERRVTTDVNTTETKTTTMADVHGADSHSAHFNVYPPSSEGVKSRSATKVRVLFLGRFGTFFFQGGGIWDIFFRLGRFGTFFEGEIWDIILGEI